MTDKLRDAAQLALEWVEDASVVLSHVSTAIQGGVGAEAEGVGGCSVKVVAALRAALAQQDAQAVPLEPVAWLDRNGFPHHISHLQPLRDMKNGKWSPLYAAPTPPAQSDDERLLRLLLAVRVAGVHLYADDGEMSDCSEQPHIDFKRDSVKEIERKLIERGMKKAWGSIAEHVAPTPPAQTNILKP